MNKKQIGFITITIILFILLLLLAIFKLTEPNAKKKSESSETTILTSITQSDTTTNTIATETSMAPRYIIGEWEGKLAVFQYTKSNSPLKIYDVYLSSLPAEEQQRLKKGIFVNDEQTLQRLLEDYTS